MKANSPRPALGVFLILLGSYAFFWHSRDWNASSRLMLTYALVDRGQVSINGLEDHTGDRARLGTRYYSDKQPGYSLLAVAPYAVCRLLGMPPHPLGRRGDGFTHWPPDYWIALGTSGVLTALCGAILTVMAGGLGCVPRRSALIGLAYGLATPAYVYATLAYGHQATACFLLGGYGAIEKSRTSKRPSPWSFLAGVCAAGASVVELQVGPVSALLGLYALGLVLAGWLPAATLIAFGIGAAGPTAVLLIYDTVAFGSPFDMGYFHEDFARFRAVHSAGNPLGLGPVTWGRASDLLFLQHRGLFVYAPILLLAIPGWFVLAVRRRWSVLFVSLGACLAVFLVNLSYPEWTGGMSTGPRLLLPLIPFAMLPVAALLGTAGARRLAPRYSEVPVPLPTDSGLGHATQRPGGVGEGGQAPSGYARSQSPFPISKGADRNGTGTSGTSPLLSAVAVLLAVVGGVEMLMFQGVGGRIPPAPDHLAAKTPYHEPWSKIVGPLWSRGESFEPTLVSLAWPRAVAGLPAGWRWVQFVPLVAFQAVAIALLMRGIKDRAALRAGPS